MAREELFSRRSTSGKLVQRQVLTWNIFERSYDNVSMQTGSNGWQGNQSVGSERYRKNKENVEISMDDYTAGEASSLVNCHREIDDMLSSGSETMSSLRKQRETLKSARTKMLDLTNTLGMSQTIMRLIEKRSTKDRIILFGGMALFTLVMIYVWFYVL